MSRYVSDAFRLFTASRAGHRCEYCRLAEAVAFLRFQIDHIISVKHDGTSELDNLAWSCFLCNLYKGSDIGTILLPSKQFVRLFNPREDIWDEHFELDDGVIYPKTAIGEATIKVLRLNDVERIMERREMEA